EAEDEILMAEMGIVLHHVPQNGTLVDFHQRLRNILGIFAESHAETAAEEDDFHDYGWLAPCAWLFGINQRQEWPLDASFVRSDPSVVATAGRSGARAAFPRRPRKA